MNPHNFKVGDVVRIIDAPDHRQQFARAVKASFADFNLRFDDSHVVTKVDNIGVFIGKNVYLLAHRLTPDRRAAPAVLPSRQMAWDKYAESRARQGAISSPSRQEGFMAGYDLGYLRGKQDNYVAPFAAEALARAKDPFPSHAAASVVQAGKLADIVLVTLRDKGPMTANDVAAAIGLGIQTVSPRFAQLKRKGLIHVSGGTKVGKAHRSIYSYGPLPLANPLPVIDPSLLGEAVAA